MRAAAGVDVGAPYDSCRMKFAAARQARVDAFPEGALKEIAKKKMCAKQQVAEERRARSLDARAAKAAEAAAKKAEKAARGESAESAAVRGGGV